MLLIDLIRELFNEEHGVSVELLLDVVLCCVRLNLEMERLVIVDAFNNFCYFLYLLIN